MGSRFSGGSPLGTTVEIAELEALAKGVLVVGDGSGAPTSLSVGANDTMLMAASGAASGVKWATTAEVRTALGLVIGTNVQAWDADLDTIAAFAKTKGSFMVGNGTIWALLAAGTNGQVLSADSGETTGLKWIDASGLGDLLAANNLSDVADAATARTNLGLAIGTNVQAYDADLAALAGLTSAADKLPYFTGAGTADVATFTAFARTILDDVDAAAVRTTLGLGSAALAATGDFAAALGVDDNYVTDAEKTVIGNTSGTNTGDVAAATAGEINTGTEATKTVTPDALAGSNFGIRYLQVTAFDYTADCAMGDGKAYVVVPPAYAGMNLVSVHGRAITAGTTGTMDVQIRNVTQAADMLTTKLTWDSTEAGTDTAATPAVIDGANDDVAANDLLAIDVDAIQTTAAKGMIITLGFQLP